MVLDVASAGQFPDLCYAAHSFADMPDLHYDDRPPFRRPIGLERVHQSDSSARCPAAHHSTGLGVTFFTSSQKKKNPLETKGIVC